MESFLTKDEEDSRKKKQAYLKEHILNAGYSGGDFSGFLTSERKNGDDIDTWRMDELETMVVLFKRQCGEKPKEDILKFHLEDIELDDIEDTIYAKKINTEIKNPSKFASQSPYVLIESIEVIDGGLFSGKSLSFTITVPSMNLKVVRIESEFKWLESMLLIEYPYVPLPPLI